MKSHCKDQPASFPDDPDDQKAHAGEYLEYREGLGARIIRPAAGLAALAWLGLGLTMDRALHAEFPGLFHIRLGLALTGAACFLLTCLGRFRKNSLMLLHVLYGAALLSGAFITGRLAHDLNYVSGLQVLVILCPFLPFRFAAVIGYYAASVMIFLSAAALYHAGFPAPDMHYALSILAVVYGLGAMFSRIADQARFNSCLKDIRHDIAYQRLHQIIEFLPDATFVIDNQGRLIAWNRAVEELTGRPAEEMIGKGNYEHALPFYNERRPVMIDLVISQDNSLDHMYAYVKRTADRFESESFIPHLKPGGAYLYNTASTLYGSDGAVIGAIESIRDITDQKMAARALEESRRHLAEVIDFFPDAVFVLDRDEKVMLWNRGMEKMTGIKAADMIGKGDYEYAVPFYGERRPVLANMALHWNEGCFKKYISVKQRKDGVLVSESFHPLLKGGIFLSGTARALLDAEGNLAGVIESLRDISDVKTAEGALMNARRTAEEASRAKSDFLARMSHELRTPLNAILGYSQILDKSENITDDHKDGLRVIHQSGVHLLTLINDILDFSKMEAGKLRLAPADMDFRSFLEDIVGVMKISAEQKGLRFDFEPAQDLPRFIRADQKRLRQVLLNLLSNAIKYTDAGRVRFRITAAPGPAGGDARTAIRFAVEDTGSGISERQMEKIFNPFEQAGKETAGAGGAGLGLAISRQLAGLMGGTIAVESAPDKGSVFSLDIDAVAPTGGQASEAAAAGAENRRKDPRPDMIPPPEDVLNSVHDLALLGKMKPIRETADRLKTTDPAYGPFADRLKLLAKSFEDKEIAAMMRTFLKKDAP